MTADVVYAAGGVVWRIVDGRMRVLLIERTRYRDFTLPKGKVERGEILPVTAVREIQEETGLTVRLGPPVGVSHYRLPSAREKIVHYWAAEATDKALAASAFRPNREVASIEWLTMGRARTAMSYPVDVEILDAFAALVDQNVHATFPLIALRHAKAMPRSAWDGPDETRPLTPHGVAQANALVAPLRAFGVRRVFTSPAARCRQTVAPFAAAIGRSVTSVPAISQDAWEEGRSDPHAVVAKRLRSGRPAVLCSHGPVLPEIVGEIAHTTGTHRGAYLGSASALDTAAFSVMHLSAHDPAAGIVAVETHAPLV